ncbi:Predicted dehydrogenase [Paenibacillus sp. UNCCL117]|uniref:Gfo/Idh/MocA family protein n=1 Tax=unclassified Paenibacillus TaxID=185978 RepID=UPI000885961C|nr:MULTISPECIES: Gfo/Idh/MocA family oxidoreductase [unclassified Paenibacillus]SDD64794.1 Predicted dehydrogenase [Paenibacillus sp. cl123]SFW58248.1 Predicted dehydrogenase [Paenibacillus sp. UNCCL117]
MAQDRIIKLGIIGQGRSGRNIHGQRLVKMPEHYRIAAIADSIPDRQELAKQEYGCNAYSSWQEMVEQEQLDLVVNASPSHLHFEITLELLNRGINVLCEKPLAKTAEEVDELIAASQQSGATLAVFQNSRFQPAFTQIRKVIESGVLGRIVQIDFTNNNFARRWDWQTLQANNGGNLMNTGPHPVDQALQFFGTDVMPDITCVMDRANTFGDAEDYVKLILRGQGRPTIDLEISSCSAYPRDTFIVQGTRGGLHGSMEKLEWKYFKEEEAPEQKLVREPLVTAEGLPTYCSETLNWHTDTWEINLPSGQNMMDYMTVQLYLMLHRHLVDGAPLEVTPQQVRQQMLVMEECRRQNPQVYQQ